MNGAQAMGCSPIAEAWQRQSFDIKPQKPNTIAKSLAIGNPADGFYALKVLSQPGGQATAVSDDEIVNGIKLLAETEGVFSETAGGVVIASLCKLVEGGHINPDEKVVVFVTGSGLKTAEAVQSHLNTPLNVDPQIVDFEKAMLKRDGTMPIARK